MADSAAAAGHDIREIEVPGAVPHYELIDWRDRYGVVAGITGRGESGGHGFDLGLWSEAPVGPTLSRWRDFRRSQPGFEFVVLGHQVHGAAVATVGGGRGWLHMDGIDGWVTTTRGTLLTVTVADCIPIYLVVPGRGVALLHAGWRGTAGGILERGLAELTCATGAAHSDVVMHCGIGICGVCYEVGHEVMTGCGLQADGTGPWYLDLREHLREQARILGLTHVTVSPWCSAHDRERFFSHRASRGLDGRMVSYLGMLHV